MKLIRYINKVFVIVLLTLFYILFFWFPKLIVFLMNKIKKKGNKTSYWQIDKNINLGEGYFRSPY
jgi:hypothetical protein